MPNKIPEAERAWAEALTVVFQELNCQTARRRQTAKRQLDFYIAQYQHTKAQEKAFDHPVAKKWLSDLGEATAKLAKLLKIGPDRKGSDFVLRRIGLNSDPAAFIKDICRLRDAAKEPQILPGVDWKGRSPDSLLKTLIQGMAILYELYTGKIPSAPSTDPLGGPLFRLVRATLVLCGEHGGSDLALARAVEGTSLNPLRSSTASKRGRRRLPVRPDERDRRARGHAIAQRLKHDGARAGLDPKLRTEAMLLLHQGLLTERQVDAGIRMAAIYREYELAIGAPRRSTSSQAYERVCGRRDISVDDERAVRARKERDELQAVFDEVLRLARKAPVQAILEKLLVQNLPIANADLPSIRPVLDRIAARFIDGHERQAKPSSPP